MKPKKRELVFLLLLALALGLWALFPKSQGRSVSVQVDGQVLGVYPLDRDFSCPIAGVGGFSLTLVIHGGTASVEDSTCPDLICQHHAPISAAGEQIICLPGRVVLTVTGEEAEIDGVT